MSLQKMLCRLGVFDIPIIQLQPPFIVDLLDSNVALFGASMSGKTTFVRTLINVLHKQYSEEQEQIFVLDFGGALSSCASMPLVSAYFDNSNEEYVKRVFKILEGILKDNIDALNGKNYRDIETDLPHTTFIIDNLNAFEDEPRYTAYQEKLAKLCREGISRGITIVMTATDIKGITKYLGNFKQKIAYEMPQDKYVDIFGSKVGAIGNNPGHGFANVTVRPEGVTGTFRMNVPYELQCSLPYGQNGEDEYEEQLKVKFKFDDNKYERCVKKYKTFPKELTKDIYYSLIEGEKEEPEGISVGLDYVDFEPVTVELEKTHVLAIYGKKEFGKTNLLKILIEEFSQKRPESRFVFFDDGRKQLQEIYEKMRMRSDSVMIDSYQEMELTLGDGEKVMRKLSPIQQFYVYLNENYVSLDKRFMAGIYGLNRDFSKECARVPDCMNNIPSYTVFVIQSKLVYLNSLENRQFINNILSQLVAVAEEYGFCFIFSDVQKIADTEQNMFFNNSISASFLLDNIAEFASERGQRSIFGSMDIKALKEDYARCELGDGYFYDVEGDKLNKLKFIKI